MSDLMTNTSDPLLDAVKVVAKHAKGSEAGPRQLIRFVKLMKDAFDNVNPDDDMSQRDSSRLVFELEVLLATLRERVSTNPDVGSVAEEGDELRRPIQLYGMTRELFIGAMACEGDMPTPAFVHLNVDHDWVDRVHQLIALVKAHDLESVEVNCPTATWQKGDAFEVKNTTMEVSVWGLTIRAHDVWDDYQVETPSCSWENIRDKIVGTRQVLFVHVEELDEPACWAFRKELKAQLAEEENAAASL
jgi:hypothetical protein